MNMPDPSEGKRDAPASPMFTAGQLAIARFCSIECELQQSGERSVGWMLNAWAYAFGMEHPLNAEHVQMLGMYVEPHRNARGFREVAVSIGGEVKDDWRSIPHQMASLVAATTDVTPEEWFRHYEEIHPFVDGNGRTGQILYNWLRGSLGDPDWAPNYWRDPRRHIGSGAPALTTGDAGAHDATSGEVGQ